MSVKVWAIIFTILCLAFGAQLVYDDYLSTPFWLPFATLIVMWVVAFLPSWGLVKFNEKED